MLGADAIDRKILRTLGSAPASTSSLARTLKLSRTTLAYRLARLKKHKLLRTAQGPGVSILWTLAHARQRRTAQNDAIYTNDDFSAILEAYQSLQKGSVIYNLGGQDSWQHMLSHMPPALQVEAQRIIIRRRFIIKTLGHTSFVGLIATLPRKQLEAHLGRSIALKVYDASRVFCGASGAIVSRSFVSLCNYETRKRIMIRDPGIVRFLFELFEMCFDQASSIQHVRALNINLLVQSELKKRAQPSQPGMHTDASH
jgi:hypothetical protein